MSNRDRLLAVIVAVCWGVNFIALDAALDHFPPIFLVALRFALIAVPTVLFVPWPRVQVRWWLLYGAGFGIAQFAFLFWAMTTGMPTGLASLVLQSSAPFTVVLGAVLLGERLSRRQVTGVAVAVAGLTVVALYRAEHAALAPLVLTLIAGLGWAVGNIGSRQARPAEPMRLMLWMCVVPPVPMFALSWAVEGPGAIGTSLRTSLSAEALPAVVGLAYVVVIGTVVGSGLWTQLMSRHESGRVAPFSMLVPVVGMSAAFVVLGERVAPTELVGAALVVGGVAWASTTRRRRASRTEPVPAPDGLEEPART